MGYKLKIGSKTVEQEKVELLEMSQELTELPDSWEWVKLGDIALPSDKKVEPTEIQSIPYIGLEHIEKDTGNLLGYGNSKDVKSTKSKFYSGDLLYGKLRPYLNKVHVVNFEGVCSTDILVFSKNSYISNEFLKYRFLTKDFVSYASQNVNGVQHPRVSFPTLADFSLALPPLNEQKRIVAKIEELNDRTQKAKEALDSIPQLCDRFRQSVLAAAFRGDLTADWREQNPDVEPVSVLLERIKSSLSPKKVIRLPEEKNFVQQLPQSWLCEAIGNVASFQQGMQIAKNTRHKESGQGRLPILRIKNYIDNFQSDIEYVDVDEKTLIAEASDILLARTGESRGKVLTGFKGVFHNNTFRLNYYQKGIFREYLIFYLNFEMVQNFIKINSNRTGQPDLTHQAFSPCPFILPPYSEQREIARRIQKLFDYVACVEKIYQSTKGYSDKLFQSILAKAFRGELVPQEPDDEPATVLLERIRAEREKFNNSKAKSKRASTLTSKRKSNTPEGQVSIPGLE